MLKLILLHSFNRTILELKLVMASLWWIKCHTFNRTILELKCSLSKYSGGKQHSFNRAILELKYLDKTRREFVSNLLIEPYWN